MKLVRLIDVDDAVLVSSSVPETDYTPWSNATTYAAEARVRVVAANVHLVFESADDGNVGHDPLTDDGTWWLEVGATNRWAMFDGAVQSQTTHADSIDVDLLVPGRADVLALLNVSGATAQVTMTAPGAGTVFDQTYSLVSTSGIADWYAYFFEPIARLSDLPPITLPPYAGATLSVTVSETGATVGVGALVFGLARDLGGTQWGAQLGITDYSVKQADEFGNLTVLERAYSKTANFTVNVDAGFVDTLLTQLAEYRAKPALWIGDEGYASSVIYGFFKDFNVEIAYPTVSVCTLELESLT